MHRRQIFNDALINSNYYNKIVKILQDNIYFSFGFCLFYFIKRGLVYFGDGVLFHVVQKETSMAQFSVLPPSL